MDGKVAKKSSVWVKVGLKAGEWGLRLVPFLAGNALVQLVGPGTALLVAVGIMASLVALETWGG